MNSELIVPVVAIVLGSLMFLIPIAGFTARFAFKPIVESMARLRESQATATPAGAEVRQLEQRVAAIEQQLEGMDSSLQRLLDAREFDRQLNSGRS